MPCFLCFVPLFALCLCYGYVLTCLIQCLWLCFARIYVFVFFSPRFVLRSVSVHAYMFGFTFFHVYVLRFSMLMHVLRMPMSRSMFMCLDLRFHMFACLDLGFSHGCVLRSMLCLLYAIFHVLVHSRPCLRA